MNSSSRKIEWTQLPIVCPYCGNHGESNRAWTTNGAVPFRLVEEVVRTWEFVATLQKNERLAVVGDTDSDSLDWESGTNLRFECVECFGQFPLPKDIDVDFE